MTAPLPEGRGFPLHRTEPFRTYMQTGLTDSPWADTASPAAKTLRAAFTSRSWQRLRAHRRHDAVERARTNRLLRECVADLLPLAGRAALTTADDQIIERATRVLKLGGLLA